MHSLSGNNSFFLINNIYFRILFLSIIIYVSNKNFCFTIILFILYILLNNNKKKNIENFYIEKRKKNGGKKNKKKKKKKKIKEDFLQKVPKTIFSQKINNNIKVGGFSNIEQNIKKLDMALKTFENNIE